MRPFGISRWRSFWTGCMWSSLLGFEGHFTSIVWHLHSRRYSEHVFPQPTRRLGASGPSQTLVQGNINISFTMFRPIEEGTWMQNLFLQNLNKPCSSKPNVLPSVITTFDMSAIRGVAQLAEELCYKPATPGFDFRLCYLEFVTDLTLLAAAWPWGRLSL